MKKSLLDFIQSGIFLTRRSLLKLAAAGSALLVLGVDKAKAAVEWLSPRIVQMSAPTTIDAAVKVVHSVCLSCNARCGVRAVVENGTLVKHSGNPYHPYNSRFEPVAYNTPVKDTLKLPSPVCGKSQGMPNYAYSPYRILKPLKRAGARGSGKFEPIEWEQMIEEIAAGGSHFAHLGEDRVVPGIKELNSDAPIDPNAPELGPVRNGFIFIGGRDQNARKEFSDRFVKDALGSINRVGHTDICGIGFRMGNWALTEKKQVEIKADPMSAEYILVFGANIYEALQPGINTYGAIVGHRSSKGAVKFTIIDPRATNASAHAENWIPIKPGQDGAFAMGMIRWMIENEKLNMEFLTAPNPKVADKRGHACHTNATHLVIVDEEHKNSRKFLRMSDLDPAAPETEGEAYVVLSKDGNPLAFDKAEEAVLDAESSLRDVSGKEIKVKTSFRLMKEGVMDHTVAEYAKLSGVDAAQITKVAKEFTSHGTRAAVTQYHGAGNYLSGTYAAYAVAMLSVMVGSVDRKGGYMKGGGGAGSWNGGVYDLKEFPGKKKPQGVQISREKAAYEKTAEFRKKGYPSQRPWFPFSRGGLSVETLSGIDQKYPYPCKILFTYFFNPVYTIPGGYRYKETLESTDKVPLHVSIDISINESNIYADYIVPDITYSEGHYGFLTPHAPTMKFTGVRTPTIEPLTGRTADGRPFGEETFLIDLARAAGLAGFGENAITGKDGKAHPLMKGEDFYLRAIANLASTAKVPKASAEEIAFVEKNYPVAHFKELLPKGEWDQVCYVLARGGVFDKTYEDVFDGEKHKYGLKRVVLYNEELATTKNSITGEFFPGSLKYVPPRTPTGTNIEEADKEYPFTVISHKMNLHTQSRTVLHDWSMEVFPENFVVVNKKDATELGLKNGAKIRLVSRSNPEGVTGKAQVSQLVRKGCLGIAFHYGHTQLGASHLPVTNAEEVFLGGKDVADENGLIPNPRYGAGLNPNDLGRLNENLANTPLIDPVGGIPDFSSTRVRIEKV
jgi:tetrathionate reductase subunit A